MTRRTAQLIRGALLLALTVLVQVYTSAKHEKSVPSGALIRDMPEARIPDSKHDGFHVDLLDAIGAPPDDILKTQRKQFRNWNWRARLAHLAQPSSTGDVLWEAWS